MKKGEVVIPIQRAKKVLKEYEASNFNATVALQKAGYTKQTATKASKDVINRAIKKVAQEEIAELVASSNPMGTLLQRVGMTRELLMGEYLKIIFQDRDMANKLKAMLPLLKPEGITWDDEMVNKSPTLNLTVKQNIEPSAPIVTDAKVVTDVDSVEPVATYVEEDVNIEETAQLSLNKSVAQHLLCDVTTSENNVIINEGGGVDLSPFAQKEGTSHPSKISEIDTIDKP